MTSKTAILAGLMAMAADAPTLGNRRTLFEPTNYDEIASTTVDKQDPATAELFDFVNTLNIIVLMEERSDKKVKRVNGIIRDYCRAKIPEARHEGTRQILRMIAKPVLCRAELTKAVNALKIIEQHAQSVIGFKE